MEKQNTFGKITGLLTLMVFAVFALCVTAVILTGARTYQKLTDRGHDSFSSRTLAQYLATRVRQGNGATIEAFEGVPALIQREELDGDVYVTRVFCFDGWLRELYAAESAQVTPEDGEPVMEASDLSFSWENELLTIEVTGQDGSVQTIYLDVPEGKAVAP